MLVHEKSALAQNSLVNCIIIYKPRHSTEREASRVRSDGVRALQCTITVGDSLRNRCAITVHIYLLIFWLCIYILIYIANIYVWLYSIFISEFLFGLRLQIGDIFKWMRCWYTRCAGWLYAVRWPPDRVDSKVYIVYQSLNFWHVIRSRVLVNWAMKNHYT